MRLSRKHIVATGAGRGIGRAIALRIAAEGGRVTCLDIDGEAARETAALVASHGGESFAVTCNTANMEDVEHSLKAATATFGAAYALVANAGGTAGERSAFLDLDAATWQRMIDRNLTGSFNCGLVYGRHFVAQGYGAIVFITSMSAELASPGLSHYCAAKGGIRQLMRCMAAELAPHGVRVNAVAPGATLTPGNREAVSTPEFAAFVRANIPIGRIGQPEELTGAVVYLVSDDATYTTGATINVDGGWSVQ